MSAEDNIAEAERNFEENKTKLLKRFEEDGVVNPKGFALLGSDLLFVATIPLTSFLAQPNGILEKVVNALCRSVAFVSSAGSSSRVSQSKKIASLSALYLYITYAFSGTASATGVNAGTKEGRDHSKPRTQVQNLKGLPLRLHSAHYNLLENFGGFALSAALTQSMAPADQTLINLLGLHVLSKVFLYYPSYLLNIGATRTVGHIVATAAVINVALKLSRRL